MKTHRNKRLLATLSPPDIPCGATNQGTHHDVWGADAFVLGLIITWQSSSTGSNLLSHGAVRALGMGMDDMIHESMLALVGFQGRGCAAGVQPGFCHALLLEALIFQEP